MNNSVITFPVPANEPVKAYLAGSPERVALEKELERQSKLVVDIPIIIPPYLRFLLQFHFLQGHSAIHGIIAKGRQINDFNNW